MAGNKPKHLPPAPTNQYIGDAEAKRIALENAGLSEANVFDLGCELDLDDGTVHYDVDFKANGYEYDYDIDATTGAISIPTPRLTTKLVGTLYAKGQGFTLALFCERVWGSNSHSLLVRGCDCCAYRATRFLSGSPAM